MALYSLDAIEIYTDDGTGSLVSYTNSAVGCSSGIFRLVTGRPTISSVSGDTSATTWYNGILADSGITCSRSARFESSGAMADASGLDFQIVNTAQFWKTLEDNGIYLYRCRVVYYYATSTDNAAWTFYRRWSGLIDDLPFGELAYNIKCVDASKDIFRTIPPITVDSNTFPLAPRESLDKVIPVSIGRVATSPTVNVNQAGDKIGLCLIDGVSIKVAALLDYTAATESTVKIYTKGVWFPPNDPRLTGNYLTVIKGGVKQSRLIVYNVQTTSAEPFYTMVFINEPFDDSTPFSGWSSGSNSADIWYCEVSKYNASMLTSNSEIYAIRNNASNTPGIYQYSSDANKYTDVSEIAEQVSYSNISSTGKPGIRISSANDLLSGELIAYRKITPSNVVLNDLSNVTGVTYAEGDVMENVFDVDRTTNAQFTRSTSTYGDIRMDVYLPFSDIAGTFDDLYLVFDLWEDTISTFTSAVNVYVTVFDIYGREANLSPAIFIDNLRGSSLTGSGRETYLIPFEYYGDPTEINTEFYGHKDELNIATAIEDVKAGLVYDKVRLRLEFESSGVSTTHTIEIREIAFVAKSSVQYTTEPIHVNQIGEVFGSEWNGRKTPGLPVLLAGDAIEKVLRDYDYNYPFWEASRAYVVGDYVRTVDDNKHYYRCSVAGTSGASEPTWSTTSGASVSDNTVTWIESGTFAIDETSFDTLASTTRSDWVIGRTLEKQKNSEEVIRELAEQAYLGVQTKPNGQISVKAFRETTTTVVDFDETNSWDLSDITYTPQRSVYNEILINYAYDYGEQKFKKKIFVTNVDRPSFPGVNEVISRGTSLGSFTATLIFSEDSRYLYSIVTSSPHGVSSGDFISIEGNTDGYNIPPTIASVVDTTTFHVEGNWSPTASSTSGTVYFNPSSAIKWKTYVAGVQSYAKAKSLWTRCHESFLVTKTVQKMPEDLSNCYWFIDKGAKDKYGNFLWDDLDDDDNHPAYYYAVNMAQWGAWPKKQLSFSVDTTSANMALNLFDCVSIADDKTTDGASLTAYISEINDIPSRGKEKEYLRISVICAPELAPEEPNRIIDTADDTDRIIDTADDTDRIIDEPT